MKEVRGGRPSRRGSSTAVDHQNDRRPLYERLLGSSWPQIAEPVRIFHATESPLRASGRLQIRHGRNPLTPLVVTLLRLPRASDAADTRLSVISGAGGEHWLRTFDGRRLETRQYQASESELAERFGALEFRFRLAASNGSLVYHQLEAAFLFGPLRLRFPAALAPRIDAREDPAGSRQIRIHVSVALPVLGPVVTYDGIIDIEDHHA